MIKRLAKMMRCEYKSKYMNEQRNIPKILLDANILCSNTLRFLFCRMARDGHLDINWTRFNIREWQQLPDKDWGIQKLSKRKSFIEEKTYSDYIEEAERYVKAETKGPNKGKKPDAHILAAAFHFKIKYVVTLNSQHFNTAQMEDDKYLLPIVPIIVHPDDLLMAIYINNPEAVMQSMYFTVNDMFHFESRMNIKNMIYTVNPTTVNDIHLYHFLEKLKTILNSESKIRPFERQFSGAIEEPESSSRHTFDIASKADNFSKAQFPEFIKKYPPEEINNSQLQRSVKYTAQSIRNLASYNINSELPPKGAKELRKYYNREQIS